MERVSDEELKAFAEYWQQNETYFYFGICHYRICKELQERRQEEKQRQEVML